MLFTNLWTHEDLKYPSKMLKVICMNRKMLLTFVSMRLNLSSAIKMQLIGKISQSTRREVMVYVLIWQFLTYYIGIGLLTRDCKVRFHINCLPSKRHLS